MTQIKFHHEIHKRENEKKKYFVFVSSYFRMAASELDSMLSAAMHFHRRRRTEISIFRFLMIALSSCEDMLYVSSIAFRQLAKSHENDTFRVCD